MFLWVPLWEGALVVGRRLLVQNTPVLKVWLSLLCLWPLGDYCFILSTDAPLAIEITVFLKMYYQ